MQWRVSGPDCQEVPDWQVHEYNPDFYILRESGCTNYEKPFLYLIFGAQRAMLVDTGAGSPDPKSVVDRVMSLWSKAHDGRHVSLLVTHSHGHGDHKAGDEQFREAAGVQFVKPTAEAAQHAFHIEGWPEGIGSIDLGGRVIDVIPIPGHQAASLAFYDGRTGVLLSGDSLYPGRLYVSDWAAFQASTRRLVDFTAAHPVTHILGCHIEQTRHPYLDYPVGTVYQPDEHALPLGRAELLELNAALQQMKSSPRRAAFRDFTIWPK